MRLKVTSEIGKRQDAAAMIWDTDVRGLGLRVTKGGVKTWVLKYWSRPLQKQRWHSIGRFESLSPTKARKTALALLVDIAEGGIPGEERKQERNAVTVNDLLNKYVSEHLEVKNKASTQKSAKYAIEGRIRPA